MASSEAPVGDFHCLECGNQVEIVHGDKKLSLNLHKLTHRGLDTKGQEVNRSSTDLFGKSNSSSSRHAPYTCQICDELVEILYNDIKLSLEIHSKKHIIHQPRNPSEDQLSNSSSSTSKNSAKKSIKVKNKQTVVDSAIIDDAFITLAPCFRDHRGFILKNADGVIFCNICKINVDIFSISDHLEAKCHENNVIALLKNLIPNDLRSSLDYLTFNRFNLVCNLCDCKIDLCSSNPHETIVNIFVHNAQNTHLSKENSINSGFTRNTDDSQKMLETLYEVSPAISENRRCLDIKVHLQFECKLCSQFFAYDGDETALLDSLNSHFIGQDHAKYKNSTLALQLFEESNTSPKDHMLIVSKGSIYCKRCFGSIPSDTKSIEEHFKSCPVMRINKNDPFFKKVQEILINIPSLVRGSGHKPHTGKKQKCLGVLRKEPPFNNHALDLKIATVKKVVNKVDNSDDISTSAPIDIRELLSSLPPQFREVGYIVEHDDGKAVTCLVCDCRIPPSHYNLETHLTGRNHRSNENKMKSKSDVSGEAASSPVVEQSDALTLVDQVFKHLTRNDPVVKANEIILMNCGDGLHYLCTACGDLIPTSTDADRFKTNIYRHVQIEKHLFRFPNQKHIWTKALPKDSYISAIDELFAALPKDLQDDRKFIKPHQDHPSSLFCSLCKVKVPIHARNLQEHLEGGYHSDLLDKLSAPQDLLSTAVGFAVNAIQDAIFQSIKMSNKLIKDNEKHLSRNGENYLCVLCKAIIQNCPDTEELTGRFLSHLEGKNHIQNVVTKLMESNPGLRDEKCYVKVKNQIVHCTKCNVPLPRAFEESILKKHVFAHFSGNRHINNSKNSPQTTSSSPSQPSYLTKTPNYSTLFNQPIPSIKPLTSPHQVQGGMSKNSKNVPHPLIDNTIVHLGACLKIPTNEPRPIIDDTNLYGGLSKNSTNVPRPLIDNNSSSGGLSNDSPNVPRPAGPITIDDKKTYGINPVLEAFRNIPTHLQVDVKYIKPGTIPDYLFCTLCNKTINPFYLKDHLVDETHIKEKRSFEERVAHWKMRVM